MEKFDPLKPFADTDAYQDFLNAFTRHDYKLYDSVNFTVVSKDDLEFDLYGGESHYTEQDILAISRRIADLNAKWETDITFCLFPSKTYPGILINVRSPNAPFATAE